MGCSYLSGLRLLSDHQRARPAREPEGVPPSSYDLRNRNDALVYLTGASPAPTVHAAKEQLVWLLSRSRTE